MTCLDEMCTADLGKVISSTNRQCIKHPLFPQFKGEANVVSITPFTDFNWDDGDHRPSSVQACPSPVESVRSSWLTLAEHQYNLTMHMGHRPSLGTNSNFDYGGRGPSDVLDQPEHTHRSLLRQWFPRTGKSIPGNSVPDNGDQKALEIVDAQWRRDRVAFIWDLT
ncbi:uncharacterized protein EV420DRAFT_1485689 [Desarmillaria tabescens]|uniref:Uncharacterized protein n=1 Tax=Armillaria tabescens TaxID=1929756 RepID=A0AA39MP89_ARMTA|nr:uncharacterized protein EV420DRAFT_1485689 [Desarmillaria tabescens]KAK0441228.1 hypothetical protein EV420DRAFT_1485689 [Desarmillaria tabescens]